MQVSFVPWDKSVNIRNETEQWRCSRAGLPAGQLQTHRAVLASAMPIAAAQSATAASLALFVPPATKTAPRAAAQAVTSQLCYCQTEILLISLSHLILTDANKNRQLGSI